MGHHRLNPCKYNVFGEEFGNHVTLEARVGPWPHERWAIFSFQQFGHLGLRKWYQLAVVFSTTKHWLKTYLSSNLGSHGLVVSQMCFSLHSVKTGWWSQMPDIARHGTKPPTKFDDLVESSVVTQLHRRVVETLQSRDVCKVYNMSFSSSIAKRQIA